MPTDSSPNAEPDETRPTTSPQDHLLTALNDWLGVLDTVLAGELNAEQRDQLAAGAAELRGIMKEMGEKRDSSG